MNEQITTLRLKQLIAQHAVTELAFVNVFLDGMVMIIREELEKGEDVTIDGLGTFRRVTTGAGKNIRVIFLADESMKEGVNAPFSQFEPVVLSQGVPVEQAVDASTDQSVDDKVVLLEEPNIEKLVTTTVVREEFPEAVIIKENAEMKRNPEDLSEDKSSETAGSQDSNQYREEMAEVESPIEVSDGNGQLDRQTEKVIDQTVADETGQKCETGYCPASETVTSKKTGLMFVIILLAICILGTLVYFLVRVNKSDKMPVKTERIVQPAVQEKTETTVSEIQPAPPQENTVQDHPAPVVPDSGKSIEAEPLSKSVREYPFKIVLKKGDRLTLLALRYYGNKSFWVYIYEANRKQYPDPEEIPAGATLLIPAPERYGIDAKSPASVQKAKEKAWKILSE